MEKAFYSPSEVSKILQVRPQTVYALLESGVIPALRLNTRWRIPIDKFNDWVDTETWTQTRKRGAVNG